MPTTRHEAEINAPSSDLWARLIDLESWPRWLRAPYADRSVTLEPPGATAIDSVVVMKGRLPYRLFARVVTFDVERRLALEIERSEYPSDRLFFGRARITIELERVEQARTRVACRHQAEGKGLAGTIYMNTLFRLFMRSNVRDIVRSLRVAEGGRSLGGC